LNGYGSQCKNFSNIGSNLCSIHLAGDNRNYPDEATRIYNKVVSKRNRIGKKKPKRNVCHCSAYTFPHSSGQLCQWPFQAKQRLECKTDLEAVAIRRKLRRKGITVNTIKELMGRGIGEDSKIIDLDCDPSDLSMEEEYLSNIQYEIDVLALPIKERRAIQKAQLIAEYMLKIGKVIIDDSGGARNADCDIEDDLVEIAGEIYKIN